MNTTKKWMAFILSLALILTLVPASEIVNANEPNTITVTLRVEDANGTLIPSTKVELSPDDVTSINDTYVTTTVVDSESVEQPLFNATGYTAAHALAKYIASDSEALTTDLTFSWGNPSHIKGEETLDYYPSWSYRVNHASPTDATTGYSCNAIDCPIKDGDTIVFFRQGCYDANIGDWGAYTNYSWFDKSIYEATMGVPFQVTYQKDDGFATTTRPASGETISVYDANNTLAQTITTAEDGTASILIAEAGSYTLVAEKKTNGIPELSRAFAHITVSQAASATATPATTVTPSATPATTVAPTATPIATITPKTTTEGKTTLSTPKNVKVKTKKNKITVSWKKVEKATGYEVVIAGKKTKTTKKTTKKTNFTKKLKKGRYTVKVRSYKRQKKSKVYSKYSKKINVTVK